MSEETKRSLVVKNIPDCEPEIGRWLWALEDGRQRTRKAMEGLNPSIVDWVSDHHEHTIGTLLYHIAIVEMDWLAIEVMENKLPQNVWDDFPYPMREHNRLTNVVGMSLTEHWRRLDSVRDQLMNIYKFMSLEEFRRPRVLEEYVVTPEWVLHHLCQHEAEHRSEMAAIRTAAG
jgi:uncharacterized damage-inducible protein DinB